MKSSIKNRLLLRLVMASLAVVPVGHLNAQTFRVLHTFDPGIVGPGGYNINNDGIGPGGGLILSGNTLYGTAPGGGSSGMGTIFALNTNSTGFKILHTFSPPTTNNTDGVDPGPGLVISGNVLYGAASGGGANGGNGTVFAINTDGTGFRTLHSFSALGGEIVPTFPTNSDGALPNGGLILSGNTLYGTAYEGGAGGSGTIFSLNINGTGFKTLYSFSPPDSSNVDGVFPNGGLVLSGNTLYGTAYGGGTNFFGAVFALNTDGSSFTNLHTFGTYDGHYPVGLALSGNMLYGTANGADTGGGTVFALDIDGSGYRNLYRFTMPTNGPINADGAYPGGGLVISSNLLYGTTGFGGSSGFGTLFELKTDGTSFRSLHTFVPASDGGRPIGGLFELSNTLYGTASVAGPAANGGSGTVFDFTWLPDLAVTFLGFNGQFGGFDFAYTNQGNLFTTATTAKLFWASGTTTNDIITNVPPIWSVPIPAGFSGPARIHIPESLLSTPPTNATYFLLVLDPDNLITESTKTNNIAFLTNTFRHVVLVMMENRSFDHFLGWLPGADGRQEGLWYTNAAGQGFPTWNLAPSFQGCGCQLPDQIFGAKVQYDNGKCDGWLRANTDTFCIGYYAQTDLPFFGQVAPNWTVCDHYFTPIMAETQPNRIIQHAAQTDALTNRTGVALLYPVTLRTVWDNLAASNIAALYYYEGHDNGTYQKLVQSTLHLWGPTAYDSISFGVTQFYQDCANGNLPPVSFVDPLFTPQLGDSGGTDDHPHSDIRSGEQWLAGIYNAIVSSPNWSSTVLIINFDEWGGFFDHVAPPPLPQIPPGEVALGNSTRLGFRVPCLIISPWSRGPRVVTEQFDHCSVLKMIENRWNLPTLTVRDANANDLAHALDLNHPNFTTPARLANIPVGPFGWPCNTLQAGSSLAGDIPLSWQPSPCATVQLQTAPTPLGPWTDVQTSGPSYVASPSLPGAFYRLVTK